MLPKRKSRRDEVCASALACFDELGYESTTIDDIRQRAQASIGSIYHHFGSKEGIAAAVYMQAFERYQQELLEVVERARTARALVRGVVFFHVDWTLEHPRWARFLLQMRRAESIASVEETLKIKNKALISRINQRIEHFVEQGALARMPQPLYTALLIGPAQEMAKRWLSSHPDVELQTLRKPLADAAWASLKARV